MFKRVLLAGLAGLALSTPADAALVRLQFTGEIDQFNSYFQSNDADVAYSAGQLAYMGGIHRRQGLTPGSTYDFIIQYDSDTVAVDGRFAFDLVSGSIGSNTDFSDFTRYAIFQQAGAYTYLNFVFEKFTAGGGTTQPIYAIFNLGDNNGDVVAGALPAVVNLPAIGVKGASFEARGAFVSSRYRAYSDSASVGLLQAGPIGDGTGDGTGGGTDGGPGGVPEPATWALMICGFGLAGAGLRRSRRALA
ncbi:PEPxxWA-CTERM sorting domain-containing protein [Phenylobacterium sp.]|uniref:PEPxxWA-CTERM sorting domain-containing protein n=1 Tax=Phenylobacterium sp. TaxID=1871053 RepID=UPI0025DD88C1|nr:PEPxxWA-CTERM sorting domain-containing protein [Phenylobacterium sp.]MBX3483803.1 PEP-CTERM sorting domain-containing protein [Phenylobacterium sp.]MCW5760181.1 PEP-CTERM sorting domain-containing protein [Phenylobacterium sp.]